MRACSIHKSYGSQFMRRVCNPEVKENSRFATCLRMNRQQWAFSVSFWGANRYTHGQITAAAMTGIVKEKSANPSSDVNRVLRTRTQASAE